MFLYDRFTYITDYILYLYLYMRIFSLTFFINIVNLRSLFSRLER